MHCDKNNTHRHFLNIVIAFLLLIIILYKEPPNLYLIRIYQTCIICIPLYYIVKGRLQTIFFY